jgi:hypothetical protein
MAKRIYPRPSRHSTNMDIEKVGREKVYLLAASIAASKYIAKDCVDFIPGLGSNYCENARAELRNLLDEFEGKYTTSLLIETAILARIRINDISEDTNKPFKYPKKVDVGRIKYDNEVYKPLSLKDALDKIIHAKTVYFDYQKVRTEFFNRYITGKVEIYGSQYKKDGNKNWKAQINLKQYIWFILGVL